MRQDANIVDQLLLLAEQILTRAGADDQQLDLIEQYVDRFAAWHQGLKAEETQLPSQQQAELLQDKHQQVMKLVEKLLSGAAAEMGQFHQRARGIMAYTDTLPKRISIAKERKG